MITFKHYIEEEKNAHLTHIDQSLLIDGSGGITVTVNFLESLINMLSGGSNKSLKIGLKWDGAPGLTAGIDPESGKFFVGTKSVFSKKIPKVNFTNEDIIFSKFITTSTLGICILFPCVVTDNFLSIGFIKGIKASSMKLSATSFKLAPIIKPIAKPNILNFSKKS